MLRAWRPSVGVLVVVATTGLSSWSAGPWGDRLDLDALRSAHDARERLEHSALCVQQRLEVVDGLVYGLIENTLPFHRAVDVVIQFGCESPGWLELIASVYRIEGVLATDSSDRQIASCYLLRRVEYRQIAAQFQGDESRAALIAARLAQLRGE